MPSARMAYVRYLPKRLSVKSETRSGEPCGSAFSAGRTTTRTTAAARKVQRSRVRIAPLRREESGRSPLDEQDHENEDDDLAEHGTETRLDDLVEPAYAHRGQDGAEELPHPARHDDHEGVDDVVLAELGADVADLGQRAAGQPRKPGAERERQGVHAARADTEACRHPRSEEHTSELQSRGHLVC